jgi:hypothetical protein
MYHFLITKDCIADLHAKVFFPHTFRIRDGNYFPEGMFFHGIFGDCFFSLKREMRLKCHREEFVG